LSIRSERVSLSREPAKQRARSVGRLVFLHRRGLARQHVEGVRPQLQRLGCACCFVYTVRQHENPRDRRIQPRRQPTSPAAARSSTGNPRKTKRIGRKLKDAGHQIEVRMEASLEFTYACLCLCSTSKSLEPCGSSSIQSSMRKFISLCWAAAMILSSGHAFAWDYEGHRAVNQLALISLPTDFGFPIPPLYAARFVLCFHRISSDKFQSSSFLIVSIVSDNSSS